MLMSNWSLRQQILSPLVLVGILFAFWFADRVTSRRQLGLDAEEDEIVLAMARELSSINTAGLQEHFTKMKGEHPGWEFAAFEGQRLVASTIPLSSRDQQILQALPSRPPVKPGRDHRLRFDSGMQQAKAWFWITKLQGHERTTGLDLVFLYSAKYGESLDAQLDRQDEFAAAALTVALVLVAVWYSGRLTRRITQIQQKVRRIAEGQTTETVDDQGQDEISDLARSVNLMATDLGLMKQRVEQAERSRLYTQLGRGIAHELRNGIHSARLALEMFREGNDEASASPLLTNSYDQLCITELLVRRLLAVGQPSCQQLTARPLRQILDNAARLLDPMFQHAQVEFTTSFEDLPGTVICHDAESMQSAIINLCLNALDAAGPHGLTQLVALTRSAEVEISVRDSGCGPAEEIAESLFKPFVTTKPEGVGLGLALVHQAVQDAGGTVGWHRDGAETVFWIKLPSESSPRLLGQGSQPHVGEEMPEGQPEISAQGRSSDQA